MTLSLEFKTTVKCCARCQGDHVDLEFKPIDNYKFATHYAICPTSSQPIMMNVSKGKKKKAPRKSSLEPAHAAFETFWLAYPKKKSKGDAMRAWSIMGCDRHALDIAKAIIRLRRSNEWLKENGAYIPYPATWLRAMGWEDQVGVQESTERMGMAPPEVKR